MLRNIVFVFLLVVSFFCSAQVQFFDSPKPLKPLNTPSSENYIFLDFDNSRLFFSRANYTSNRGGTKDKGDIWVSTYDSAWTTASNMPLNDDQFTAPAGLTPDGRYFLFHKVWFSVGLHYGGVFAKPLDGGEVFQVDIPFFKNRSPIQTGTISADGRYLLLSLENNLGYGVDDLFVCQLQPDGSWSAPKNLGSVVNTPLQELTPFLAEDNQTLYFASNGLGGQGSFDIFQSTRLDDTWQNWSSPKNLGMAVNTSGSETSFTFRNDSDYAYFVSTQNSDGYGDIKRIKITSDIVAAVAADTLVSMVATSEEEVFLTLYLLDKISGEPLQGTAHVVLEGDTTIYPSGDQGEVQIPDLGQPLNFEFKADGYLSSKRIFSRDDFASGVPVKVMLDPLSTGNNITLEHVLFYRGTANFVEGSEEELDLVVEMMNENPDVKIFLKGHTDNVGNEQLNVYLSKERVIAVTEYLVSGGIAAERISGEGYGGSRPIASNADEASRKLNRRVEFEVVRD
ncbi:OmpA family protein [Marinoscillum sp.]|uniref:OmpA family protein n=1 Tax=Marinoscillum sp. TaxID=2024838 RepID=UPI003BA9190D